MTSPIFDGSDRHQINIPQLERVDTKEVEKIDKLNQWSACCCKTKTDSRLLKFASQYIVILMITTFSLTKLWSSTDCSTDNTYVGLLTLMVGLVLPQPK